MPKVLAIHWPSSMPAAAARKLACCGSMPPPPPSPPPTIKGCTSSWSQVARCATAGAAHAALKSHREAVKLEGGRRGVAALFEISTTRSQCEITCRYGW